MLDVLKNLPSNSFVRIHKSYIANINGKKIINSNQVMLETGEWINIKNHENNQIQVPFFIASTSNSILYAKKIGATGRIGSEISWSGQFMFDDLQINSD